LLYLFEDYVFDTDQRELRRGPRLISLQPQVFDLLEYLIRNRERVVTKDDLFGAIWGGRIVSESALTTRINAARTAIGDNGEDQRLIRTLPRKGLRFVGMVREGEHKPVENLAEASAAEIKDASVTSVSERPAIAELRQLTIISCELLFGAVRMDPEDLRDVIDAYHRCVAETAGRFAGTIGHVIGRTIFIYFGYPAAHEDDAEQAVRTALELCAAVKRREPHRGLRLQARIGISTGQVIVDDAGGEHAPVGEAPGTAAQLHNAAQPDTVLIDSPTRQMIGSLFNCRKIQAISISGAVEPLTAWQVLGSGSIESRFEALRSSALTPLVGRDEELELLLRRWTQAKSGEGRVVLISGEPGIGKSRLTAALLERLAGEPHTRLRYFCSPQHTDNALYPIIGQMERAAGLMHDDTPQSRLDKLDAVLAQSSTSPQDAALVAEMLSLPNDGRYATIELAPQQRRQKTLEALIGQMQALAQQNPVLMIFEDAHWTDPTSLELFGSTVDRIRNLRVLLIVTFRMEFEPPWIGQPHVTALTINRLAQRDIRAVIDRVAGNRLLSAIIRQDIVERTDGIPLFVEEMTKAVLEAEGESAAEHLTAVPSPTLAVPASLRASLMARLDRLGPAKEVAQIGAAIGREFSHALLAAVVRKSEVELGSALDRLVAAGLLFQQGRSPHANYLFKHALVQDAAYSTLLREPRRALHARIAEALESQFAEIAESRPVLLAHHCTEAGLIEKAAGLWGKAGQRSLEQSAFVEAVEQLSRALAQIAALPATPALRREQIKLQVALITPLIRVKGDAAPETKAAVERARLLMERAEALGEPPEDPLLLFSVLYGLWTANWAAFNGDTIREIAAQFLTLAERQGAIIPVMIGHRLMGSSMLCTGDISKARAHYDQAIALYDPVAHRPLAARFAQDIRVASLSFRSLAQWMLGYPDAALADVESAHKDAREIGHAVTLIYALFAGSMTQFLCGNFAMATAEARESVALADEKGALVFKAVGTVTLGCSLAESGEAGDAIQMIATGITALRASGATLWASLHMSHLARAYTMLGQFDDAWSCINEAITAVDTTKERWWEAEVHRIAGEIALKSPQSDAATAQAYFERAIAVAREQQAKSWELRAAMSLARLFRDKGKRNKARDLLAPVYVWFTEGFDTLDLKEAKALLDDLAS
jgi:DNA-binding winged helix-turn-helix (wHTH) protein/class 3 adenylate cyclase/predicted ATPase